MKRLWKHIKDICLGITRMHGRFQLRRVFLADTPRTSKGQMLQPGTPSQCLSIWLIFLMPWLRIRSPALLPPGAARLLIHFG